MVFLQKLCGCLVHFPEIDKRRFASERFTGIRARLVQFQIGHIDVFGNGAKLEDIDFLRNIPNTKAHGIMGIGRLDFVTFYFERARVGTMRIDSVEHFQQGGLTRSVFANQP